MPGKLGLSHVKVYVFEFAGAFFFAAAAATVSFPLPIATMCAGTVMLIVDVNRLVP